MVRFKSFVQTKKLLKHIYAIVLYGRVKQYLQEICFFFYSLKLYDNNI